MASTGKKVLIIGPGFIGWNVLELLAKEGYEVTGFTRRQKAADQLKASGATQTVLGDINDKALITKLVLDHDIVVHTASADHAGSAEAVLDGVQQRAAKDLQTIYIHTSGTSVIGDGTPGQGVTSRVFHDNVKAEVDGVPDTAPHRQIDLGIIGMQQQLLREKKAKIAIIIPPLIYGLNPDHKRLSIQIPTLARYALKHGFAAYVGPVGDPVWSVVHVKDLARGYVTLLHRLEKEAYGSPELENPYYFCEASGDSAGEVSWREIATLIGEALHARGLIEDPKPRPIPKDTYGDIFGADYTEVVVGLNSRSRAVRLRELGWKPVEKGWRESFVEDELPIILEERDDWKTYDGYAAAVSS